MAVDEYDAVMQRVGFEIFESGAQGQIRIPADDATIKRFENKTGLKLPQDYREFLRNYGGAYLTDVVVMPGSKDPRLGSHFLLQVNFFLGFYSDQPRKSVHDLSYNYDLTKQRLPAGLVQVAESSSDDPYCISCVNDTTYGHVYLCMPEGFEDEKPEDYLFLIARNFTEFLQSLRKMTPEEVAERYRLSGG
jgi:SMI1 / KNR4 family (SUKH-1)